MFAFLDSWGSIAVPLDVVRRFARRGSEVFVTLGRRFWRQFGTTLDPAWDGMFGTGAWRRVATIDGAAAQARFLADQYRQSLRSAGFRFLLDFELVDERGDYLYLIHATTNDVGLAKMKDAIWKVDPVAGAGFRDPRDVGGGQQMLGLEWRPNIQPLKQILLDHLASGPKAVEQLRQLAVLETIYKASHASSALAELADEGLVRSNAGTRRLTKDVTVERT